MKKKNKTQKQKTSILDTFYCDKCGAGPLKEIYSSEKGAVLCKNCYDVLEGHRLQNVHFQVCSHCGLTYCSSEDNKYHFCPICLELYKQIPSKHGRDDPALLKFSEQRRKRLSKESNE